MSSAMERRVAKLEHDARIDREQIINISSWMLEIMAAIDPDTLQEAMDDHAREQGLEPGGSFWIKPYGSETN
jgi:hypothetical protein